MTPQGVPATSKRNRARRATAVTTAPAASPAAKDPPPDILRRLLLVLVCVLVVARPLVGSEHPGLVSDFSDPGGMVLTFLTFLACAGWVGWRAWRGETPLYFGWVDLAFLALALAVFLGATHASYKRPAWLAGWDWVGLALLVLLVRQLAVRPEERHGLVALLLASVVALAGEALFQAFYTLPKQHTAIEAFISEESSSSPDQFLPQQMAVRGITPTPLEMFELQRRLDGSQVYGPYYHPESLAAVLALAIPLLFGAVFACIRGGGAGWQMSLASFALRRSIASGRRSSPSSSSRSNASMHAAEFTRSLRRSRSNTARPSALSTTISPSIRQERAGSDHTASSTAGKRADQSLPRRVKSRTPVSSWRA